MKVEIWSDVVCPWCYIGKRRIEAAAAEFDEPLEIEWRSFQLDPTTPQVVEEPVVEMLAKKYRVSQAQADSMMQRVVENGSREGLTFDFESARTGNTFDAHRLLHFAETLGKKGELKEALLRGYFSEGLSVGDHRSLEQAAAKVGLAPADVREVLDSDAFAESVQADIATARQIGATGVPFFLFEDKYAVSGAQEASTLVQVMKQVQALRPPNVAAAAACDDTSCDLPT